MRYIIFLFLNFFCASKGNPAIGHSEHFWGLGFQQVPKTSVILRWLWEHPFKILRLFASDV